MRFFDDFLCLKKSRLHDFVGKFIEQLLDLRAIAENEEVKIECIRKLKRDVQRVLALCDFWDLEKL